MSKIKVIPLGGVRENGKNMYVVEVDELIFILDSGLLHPESELLGIDIVIPDFTYLEQNKERIAGVFLTHGHEDAVGALPYLLEAIDIPVFGTAFTIELAKMGVESNGLTPNFDNYHVVNEKTAIEFDNVTVKFFRTTHSIPDSVAIVLDTKAGSIVYTGDFKFDQSATDMYKTDFAKITEVGEKKVLALLSDSSDAESIVENVSDLRVTEEIIDTFNSADGRVIVSCVSSNIMRIQQVFNAAYETKRKIFLTGTKLLEIIDIAIKLEKLILPSRDVLVTEEKLDNYRDDQLVILETGQSGEPIASLQRMAENKHRQVSIKEGDLVYITTTPSTSMETRVAATKNMLYRAGAVVKEISDSFKVSGHATPNDLKLMINLLKPEFFIPVQGEYRKLAAHAELANEVGIPFKNIFIPGKGDVIEFSDDRMRVTGQVATGNVLIDGIGVGDIGNIVLRDRKLLADDGIFVAVITISRRRSVILSGPEIISRGFVYMKESEELIQETTEITRKIVEENLKKKDFEWSTLKQEVRDALSKYLFDRTKRRPVILPIIMEASSYSKKK